MSLLILSEKKNSLIIIRVIIEIIGFLTLCALILISNIFIEKPPLIIIYIKDSKNITINKSIILLKVFLDVF